MAMALSRPSTCSSTRPAYLDNHFRDAPPLPTSMSPSLRSSHSSFSTGSSSGSAFALKLIQSIPRPLSPAFEDPSDKGSIRSLRTARSSRLRLKNIFHRRTYPQVEATPMLARSVSAVTLAHSQQPQPRQQRRPSLPKLQTSLTSSSSSPPRKPSVKTGSPLDQPAIPAQELSCHRCYYFAARNCNGWVMGGGHGDACETCLNAGFFGQP